MLALNAGCSLRARGRPAHRARASRDRFIAQPRSHIRTLRAVFA